MSSFFNVLIILFIFCFIVLIHEFGHYLMCRICKIGIIEFSVGMGPCILKKKVGDTQYSLRVIPVGGYCMMMGEDDGNVSDERAFNNHPVWQRILVVLGGPIFNFILAFVVSMVLIGMTGYLNREINYIAPDSAAQEAGLMVGDELLSIDGEKIYDFRDVTTYMQFYRTEEAIELTYKRDGEIHDIRIQPKYMAEMNRSLLGIQGGYCQNGDIYTRNPANPLEIVKYSALEVRYWIKTTFVGLKELVTGGAKMNQMSGIVGVADQMNDTMQEAKQEGGNFLLIANIINFIILISANLGVMNLLPFPALDGGRFLFLLIEAIFRKPVPKEKEAFVHGLGFVLLLILMVVITFKDIYQLIFF